MLLVSLLCVFIILFICFILSTRYRIMRTLMASSEALAYVNIALEKRYEMIPKVVEILKKSALNENKLFEELSKSREQALSASSLEEIAKANALITSQLSTILSKANAIPKLKTDNHFKKLEKSLRKTEAELSEAQNHYNIYIKQYNYLVTTFPNVIIAYFMGAKKRKLFE